MNEPKPEEKKRTFKAWVPTKDVAFKNVGENKLKRDLRTAQRPFTRKQLREMKIHDRRVMFKKTRGL